jgi:hypothetical protein
MSLELGQGIVFIYCFLHCESMYGYHSPTNFKPTHGCRLPDYSRNVGIATGIR